MAKRLHQTLADYVVIAISPALIMALVGSLVFFLLKVFYQGQYFGRLHWVMACFVFAAVLIGRISIEEGFERAVLFGIALAVPVGIATSKFVEIEGTWVDNFGFLINWGLIGLIWWCAHKLTWDCTVIDDAEDASGEGLLQITGFDKPAAVEAPAEAMPESTGKKARRKGKQPSEPPLTTRAAARLEGTTSREVPKGWWERYVEKSHRPHAPGVWVVYFSLAALPLFGIGQWFIPAADVAGRRYAFWLLAIYVAAGLGLLLTTSFLGLRRYLRQRRIEMPTLMANLWLTTGAAVIGLLLVLAALLPRPGAEYSISELPFSVGSPESSSSRHAPVSREGAKDDNPDAAPQSDPTGQNDAKGSGGSEKTDAPPRGEGGRQNDEQAGAKQSADGKSQSSESRQQPSGGETGSKSRQSSEPKQNASNEQRREAPAGRQQSDNQQSQEKPGSPPQPGASEQAKSESESARQPKAGESRNPPRSSSEPAPQQERQNSEQQQEQPQQQQQPQSDANENKSPEQTKPLPGEIELPPPPTEKLQFAGELVAWLKEYPKYVLYVVVAVVVAAYFWRSRAELLAALREILRSFFDLFAGLWGPKRRAKSAADDPTIQLELPPTPFSSYADPFASGVAASATTEELVRYSFEAFEAWSREHGCPRNLDETPHELARAVAKGNPPIAAEARSIAELYARAAFARGELPSDSREQLRALWRRMTANSRRPVEQL